MIRQPRDDKGVDVEERNFNSAVCRARWWAGRAEGEYQEMVVFLFRFI